MHPPSQPIPSIVVFCDLWIFYSRSRGFFQPLLLDLSRVHFGYFHCIGAFECPPPCYHALSWDVHQLPDRTDPAFLAFEVQSLIPWPFAHFGSIPTFFFYFTIGVRAQTTNHQRHQPAFPPGLPRGRERKLLCCPLRAKFPIHSWNTAPN